MNYEMTKTIRFTLKPENDSAQDVARHYRDELRKGAKGLPDFASDIEGFSSRVRDILFFTASSGAVSLRTKIKVKRAWLRTHLARFYFDLPKEERINEQGKAIPQFALDGLPFIREAIDRWFDEWDASARSLREIAEKPLEDQSRDREAAAILLTIQGRGKFDFMRDLLLSLCRINDASDIDDLVRECSEDARKLEAEIARQSAMFAPSLRGSGLRIAKGTFNYFTLNKSPKELDNEEKETRRKLSKKISPRLFRRVHFERGSRVTDFDCTLEWLRSVGFSDDLCLLTIEKGYATLKDWKAEKKQKFLEATDTFLKSVRERGYEWSDYDRFKDEWQETQEKFPLFAASDEANKRFVELSWEKGELDAKKSRLSDAEEKQDIQGHIKEISQERGKFFNRPNEPVQTQNYYELCELFKWIALEYGNIKASLLGIENERRESQLLRYWCFLAEKGGRRYIVFVPKALSDGFQSNAKAAKEELFRSQSKQSCVGEIQVHFFQSLTFRALWKLCFKKTGNTFFPPVRSELINRFHFNGRDVDSDVIRGLQMKLPAGFYQNVLKTNAARSGIGISPKLLDMVVGKTYDDSKEWVDPAFVSDLERACYERKTVSFNEADFGNFLKQYEALLFEIDSQDIRIGLEGNVMEGHTDRAHTEIWKAFWDADNERDGFRTRLNPEVSVFYREPDEEMKRKFSGEEKKQNRYLHEHFTLATSMTLNAGEKKSDLSFKTTEDIVEYIDDFNQEFDACFKGEWRYGIDRGLKELATLCIARFPSGNNIPEFAKIPVWRLKRAYESSVLEDRNGKSRSVAKNLSYFIEREELFEYRETGCIDLTMAKVVDGKIVENADAETYFRLKERSARRRIFELLSRAEIDGDSNIFGDTVLKIANKKTGEYSEVYWLTERQRGDETAKESIRNRLQGYLSELSEKNAIEDIETIEEINHLRDAITANMVGIMAHLQKQFPGKVALENMEWKEHIERQTVRQSYENISRRLEWALYRKFQGDGSVPPLVKQSVLAREFLKERQFGIIRFVPIEQTSNRCPKCGGIGKKHGRHYRCGENNGCGFRTDQLTENDPLKPLENADKVAAYNMHKSTYILHSLGLPKR